MPDLQELTPQHPLIAETIGSELSRNLGVVNSEGRILQMGAILLESEEAQTIQGAFENFSSVNPNARFLTLSYFRNVTERLPQDSREIIDTGSSVGERQISLTDLGQRQAGLGGHLLELSLRTNIALRRLLGGSSTKPAEYSPQENYLMLGAHLGSLPQPALFAELLDSPKLPTTRIGLVDRLNGWHEAGIVDRDRPPTNNLASPYHWQFTEKGRVAFQGLVEIIDTFQKRPDAATDEGLEILDSFYKKADKRKVVEHLFRRDYLAAGSHKKGGTEELDAAIRAALDEIEPETQITTVEIAESIGRDSIHPLALHRLEWLQGPASPIVFDGYEGRNTVWRVAPPRPTISQFYRDVQNVRKV